MFLTGGIALELTSQPLWLAQVLVEPPLNPAKQASFVFSGIQFFASLVAGVVMAFAFQFLLTNLGVALGISLAGNRSSSDHSASKDSESLGGTIRKIGFALGLATLISVTISLLFASFFAVQLSAIPAPFVGKGAILGLVIWATFFLLLFVVSSTTVGSFIGSVINTATAGLQAILGTAASAIGGTAASAMGGAAASRQVVATAEAAASAIRRELTADLDPQAFRESMEDYLQALRPPELNLQAIRSEFESMLNDPNLRDVLRSGNLGNVNRQTFVDLVSSRTDLSKRDVNRIAEQLESVWNKMVSQQPPTKPTRNAMEELVDYIKSATPDQLLGKEFTHLLGDLVDELRQRRQSQQTDQQQSQQQAGPAAQAMTLAFNSLIGLVLGRADLSDLDVERIIGQLKQVKNQVGDQAHQIAAQVSRETPGLPYSTVQADVENYILNTPSWQMKPERIERDFREVLYDPEAEPGTVADELEQLHRSDFADLLQQKGMFTQARIREIANQLEAIRLEVMTEARAAQERGRSLGLLREVEQYLLTTPKQDLTPEKIQLNFKPILEDSDADYGILNGRLAQFDRSRFAQVLSQRQDFTQQEIEEIIPLLETARDRAMVESQEVQEAAKARIEAQWLKVQAYLRDTGRNELNPKAIEQDLKLLLHEPTAGLAALRMRASRFDRDTLVQLLSQRQDLSEEQVNHLIDRVEGVWSRISHAPEQLAGEAKHQYDQVMSSIADYLRSTGKEELNPEGIRRDLTTLLNHPKAGTYALQSRLARMDRDTLVKLLSQRQDLSEAQVNQIINQVQSTIRSLVRVPRRLATRTEQQVYNFQHTLADYLRSTGKEELNPDGIKRDIQLLLHDPRAGALSLSDRLSHFDQDTLRALLSQRGDISDLEVNRVVEQILGVRNQLIAQMRDLQASIQAAIDQVFAKIRNYLNSLHRPELNYDGIKADLRQLFDDPQAGFEALRDRLSHFDRDTLVALLSSRDDISAADVNRVIDQIERTRNSVLQRAERMQLEAQRRIEAVKHEAQRQAEETRKAAANAAWWLFGTATVSGIASAIAGALAVFG